VLDFARLPAKKSFYFKNKNKKNRNESPLIKAPFEIETEIN
jgi:hypothetical protein